MNSESYLWHLLLIIKIMNLARDLASFNGIESIPK